MARQAALGSIDGARPEPVGETVSLRAVGGDPQPPLGVDREVVGMGQPPVFADGRKVARALGVRLHAQPV